MASGGARAQSGPAPDPDALRRDRDGGQWITLSPAGRGKKRAPTWPLSKARARETVLWTREWKRPQAVMWERLGLELEVALYVRTLVDAEKLTAPTNVRTLVKQQQEALGISLPGLARNRWRIGEADAHAVPVAPKAGKSRDRFRVVPGGKPG